VDRRQLGSEGIGTGGEAITFRPHGRDPRRQPGTLPTAGEPGERRRHELATRRPVVLPGVVATGAPEGGIVLRHRPVEQREELLAVARRVEEPGPIGELRQRAGRPVFVTAGRRGIWVSDPEPSLVRGVRISEPTDPTGAGDSVNAGGVLALCAGADLREAALVANLVGSITVQQLATTGTARPDELGPRLEMWRGQG